MNSDQKITYFSEYLTKDANIISILPNFTPAIRFDIFFIPLILAGTLVFIGPEVTSKINIYIEKSKDKAIKNRQKLEKDRLLTPEQSRRLRKELNEIHQEYEDRLSIFDKRLLEKDNILAEVESSKIDEIEKIRISKESEIDSLRHAFQSEIETNKNIHNTQKSTISQLEKEHERLKKSISKYTNEIENTRVLIDTRTKEIKELEIKLDSESKSNNYNIELLHSLKTIISSRSMNVIEKHFRNLVKIDFLKNEACIIISKKVSELSDFNQADIYFDNILLPHIDAFSLDDLQVIEFQSKENPQVFVRKNFEETISLIKKQIYLLKS